MRARGWIGFVTLSRRHGTFFFAVQHVCKIDFWESGVTP
jgi:hypothetical protein